MKFKRLGKSFRRRSRVWIARLAPFIPRLVAARVLASVLMFPSSVVAAESAAPRALSPAVASAVEAELASVFQTQSGDGTYALPDARRGLGAYPLFATLARDAHATTGNTALLSQAAYSIARHYGALFATRDRDGDRQIETPAPWGAPDTRTEDPAFNALVALDTRSLARVNLTLRRTMAALYWYDGSRAIERAVVTTTFDPVSGYFFPVDPRSGRPVRHLTPVAALPAAFDGLVGDNHADAIAARHLAGWVRDLPSTTAGADATALAVERLIAIEVLRDRGRSDAVASLRALDITAHASGDVLGLYAASRAMHDEPLSDPELALDIFLAVARASRRLSDADIVRLDTVRPELVNAARGHAPVDVMTTGSSVRSLYAAISTIRESLRTTAFWTAEDRRAYPGVDPGVAAQRLLDDALRVARRVENRLFDATLGASGVRVTGALSRDAVVTGDNVALGWTLSTTGRALDLKTLQAGVQGDVLAPAGGPPPVQLQAGAKPIQFVTRVSARGGAGALRCVTFMLTLEDTSGRRARRFIERSFYVHPPVGAVARFPRGRTIETGPVPIRVTLRRHSSGSSSARYYWFSPSGLRLLEGNQGTVEFAAADSAVVTLNVEIPQPCRPGVFPFTLKFFVDERDAGTITSELFKPYQWTVVGPFASGGLDKKLPPETGVGLLQTYDGKNGKLAWQPVPSRALGVRGDVAMRGLMDARGVGYLYTVVECAYETDIEARMKSNVPAALFVNGRRATSVTAARGDSVATMVHLDADRNHILIKFVGDASSVVAFALGNHDNLAADEFNNDLAELAGGYRELLARQDGDDGSREARRLVTFRYEDPTANSVSVVGSFNGWSPETHRLQKNGEVWELTLSLPPGRHTYRFLVDQNKQVLDPSSSLSEPDGYGGRNSVVVVSR